MAKKLAPIVLLLLFFSDPLQAKCNLRLIKAGGAYLLELEKAGLQQHQNAEICKVVYGEYLKCTKLEQSSLIKSFDPRKIFGQICMPHLPPPPSSDR